MEELIKRIEAATGLDAETAQKAVGAILNFLKSEGPDGKVAEMLAKLRPLGETLNCADELAGVESILEHGPSYLRQRKIHKQTGRLEAVVDALIEEWRTNQRIDSV